MLFVIELFIFIIIFICIFQKDDLFSPWNISLFIWILEITLYGLIDFGLDKTTGNIESAVFLWVIPFVMSSKIISDAQSKNKKRIIYSNYNTQFAKLYYIIAILGVPLSAYFIYKYASSLGFGDNLFFNLRYTTTQSDFDNGIVKYSSSFATVLLLGICNKKKINKLNFIIIFLLGFLTALMSMSKTSLFSLIVPVSVILCYNKKVKPTIFIYIFVLFILLTVLLAGLRSFSGDTENVDIIRIIGTYTLSPLVAFDKFAQGYNQFCFGGENTFRFIYAVLNKLDPSIAAESTIQEFINVPYPTNVYTSLIQYYSDFGYLGILVFSLVNGCIYGYVYSKINYNPALKIFYAYLTASLFLQFFIEMFWVTLSITIQVLILSYLLYSKRVICLTRR